MMTSRQGYYSTVNDLQTASQETPPTLRGNVCYGQLDADIALDDSKGATKSDGVVCCDCMQFNIQYPGNGSHFP